MTDIEVLTKEQLDFLIQKTDVQYGPALKKLSAGEEPVEQSIEQKELSVEENEK